MAAHRHHGIQLLEPCLLWRGSSTPLCRSRTSLVSFQASHPRKTPVLGISTPTRYSWRHALRETVAAPDLPTMPLERCPCIDLHWSLVSGNFAIALATEKFRQDARPHLVECLGPKTITLSLPFILLDKGSHSPEIVAIVVVVVLRLLRSLQLLQRLLCVHLQRPLLVLRRLPRQRGPQLVLPTLWLVQPNAHRSGAGALRVMQMRLRAPCCGGLRP